ncbi:DUF3310 domain-containing protein [Komagataeibacter sp. FNDCR1]|nr:DUF3310 domain-containing protein [Komagataeibacter sp. FNDCR1]
MTEQTHTPYQMGRRAAERGADREAPRCLLRGDGGKQTMATIEWLEGYDSVPVAPCDGKVPDTTVNHPRHYNAHPSGIECIQVVEHMSFNLGNALKYIWRADEKGDALEDLKKAAWYIQREIARREAA